MMATVPSLPQWQHFVFGGDSGSGSGGGGSFYVCSRDLVAKEKHLIVELCACIVFWGWWVICSGGFGAGVDCGAGIGAVE
eukprot:15327602-Ditylum_brightwellii.AAC.1